MKDPRLSGAEAIQDEYRRLDGTWLKMQCQVLFWIVIFAAVMETVMFFILRGVGAIQTSSVYYALKYVTAPCGANFLLLAVMSWIRRSTRRSEQKKIWTVSIIAALICFVLYTVHSVFPALYLIFTLPMILTIVYADRRLTSVVAVICIVGKILSDFCLKWDTDRANVLQDQLTTVDFWLSIVILCTFYVICLALIQVEREKNNVSLKLEWERRRLQAEAVTDSLTGIGNRQALRRAFNEMEQRPKTLHTLAMIDVDNFKLLNDTWGHACGDTYLTALGTAMRAECAQSGEAFRFGGDEFCILFHGLAPCRTEEICQNLQRRFCEEQAALNGPRDTTLSIGIADYRFGEQPFELLQRADKALYRAKQEKNHIIFYKVK
ncbi:MAG: GGDEF domain-containing protein [Oscillibacter sp.]|nr:GGDEF domain-containing protein [Oscillibacter sp.]